MFATETVIVQWFDNAGSGDAAYKRRNQSHTSRISLSHGRRKGLEDGTTIVKVLAIKYTDGDVTRVVIDSVAAVHDLNK